MNDYELNWKRDPRTGRSHAIDTRDHASYIVARDDRARPGSQWYLTAQFQDLQDGRRITQTRAGFSKQSTAKNAALATRCHLCTRHRPFAAMEGEDGIKGWRCRDREDCAAASAARDAEFREAARQIRDTPFDEIAVRETEDGPELVFRRDYGHGQAQGTVIQATEADLLQLSYVLLTWFRTRYADELAKITEARKAARS